MDKDKLKQYIPLKKELEMLDKKLEKLYVRQENIPEVLGKVTGSSLDLLTLAIGAVFGLVASQIGL